MAVVGESCGAEKAGGRDAAEKQEAKNLFSMVALPTGELADWEPSERVAGILTVCLESLW